MKWFVQVHKHHGSDGTRERIWVPAGPEQGSGWPILAMPLKRALSFHPGRIERGQPPAAVGSAPTPESHALEEGMSPQEHMAAEGYRPCGFPRKNYCSFLWPLQWLRGGGCKREASVSFLSQLSFLFGKSHQWDLTGALLVSGISALSAPSSTGSLHFHLSCRCVLHWKWVPSFLTPFLIKSMGIWHPSTATCDNSIPPSPSAATPWWGEVRESRRFLTLSWN